MTVFKLILSCTKPKKMIRNYFRTALRNLVRHKAFSFINISGLAIGVASCLLLFAVVKYELSYDTFQPQFSKIYHVVTQDKRQENTEYNPGIPFPSLEALRTDFPGTTFGALMINYGSQVTVLGNSSNASVSAAKFIEDEGFFFADPSFFKIFTYKWLSGSPELLSQPNVTVLTQKMGDKYFGNWRDAVGKYLRFDNSVTVKVVGILEDTKINSDFRLQVVTSFETVKANGGLYYYSTDWGATTSNFQIYMLMPGNTTADAFNKQLLAFADRHYDKVRGNQRTNFLQPLSAVHFDKRFETFGGHATDKSTLLTLSIIGIFIILMACINFINLSTAQAVGRSKEVGIRKVLGSYRRQLFGQVIGETSFIVMGSVLLGFLLAFFSLPFVSHVASIQEKLSLFNWQTIGFTLALIVLVTLLAGIYPALILSGFKPALALKNKITSATVGGISLRRGLVVAQFAISQVLIIGTIVAVSQMKYVKNADLGFVKDALFVMRSNVDSTAQAHQKSFAGQLMQVPGVEAVSFSNDVPSSESNWSTNFAFDHRPDETFNLFIKFADENYFKTFGLKLAAGRGYNESDTTNEVVINETLVKKLGLKDPQQAIGKDIRMGSKPWNKIVGVVKDFKTNSLREEVKPIIIAEKRDFYTVASVKLRSTDIKKTQAAVEASWNRNFPEFAYTSSYVEDDITEFYKQEDQLALLYKIFAGIAIFISCLGLYGLVTFMSVQKTKEIGVRKVLGASVSQIIYLFSKEFTLLIVIGSLIAIPVAYYMMNSWLQNFVFRIKLSPFVFIGAVLLSLLIAWIAVGYKSVKAALANPVKSIRTE